MSCIKEWYYYLLQRLRLVQSIINGQSFITDQYLPLSVLCLCVYELIALTSGKWLNYASDLGRL
jgi:hypothetical protein